jgi:hypothetical protein
MPKGLYKDKTAWGTTIRVEYERGKTVDMSDARYRINDYKPACEDLPTKAIYEAGKPDADRT